MPPPEAGMVKMHIPSGTTDVWREILNQQHEREKEDGGPLWDIRHSLTRSKPQSMVIPSLGNTRKPAIGEALDPENPPKIPFTCRCKICCHQYFPATIEVNDKEAHQLITSLVVDARQDLDFLRRTIAEHADYLVTRWKKKSREKRSVFLSENVDIFDKKFAAVHLLHMRSSPENCDYTSELMQSLEGLGDERVKAKLAGALHQSRVKKMISAYQDTWLLPYLDSDMLSKDSSLLLALLHHRTSHEPEEWILFDDLNVDLAERFGIVTQTFNPHCVVVQGPDFGKMVEYNADQAHRYEIIGFTKAHNILLAQQRMMAFLRKIVTGLLDEANEPPVIEFHPKWAQLIGTSFSHFDSTFAWSTESVRPFSSPPKFDPIETIELVRSRHRVLKDHLEQLQTDPAYVQLHARTYKNALFFETMRHEDIWPHIVDQVFVGPMIRECYWRQMLYECDKMERAWLKMTEFPSEANKLYYNETILYVQDLCVETLAVFINHCSLIYQRGFERNFKFSGSGRTRHLNRRFDRKDWFPDDILYWSISCLGHDSYRPFTMDPSLNFTVIDYLCRTDPKEASRMDQNLVDELSDMAVLNSISNNIQCRPSHGREYTLKLPVEEENIRADWIKKSNTPKDKEMGDTTAGHLSNFCTNHLWPKGTKNEQWLQQATQSREALDRFWEAFRSQWAKKLRGTGVKSSSIDEDLDLMSASKKEECLAEIAAERDEVRHQEYKRRMEGQNQPVSPIESQTMWGDENKSSVPLAVRSKAKRRNEGEPSEESAQPPPTTANSPSRSSTPPSLIAVKHDNMAVFHHMFPSSGQESQRCFSWQHFLNAMIDAGFSILQSQGSAVTLRQDEERGEGVRTIVVHRPHPSPTISPVMLRSIAKRMTKWFGWKRELFIERGKERKGRSNLGSEA
ncbi:hypothetical protein D6C88_04965 [Aureobasidium pullulans]|nr:hypothetical protein D6C88_04965 [Aureobasidium pullulans]